MKQSEFVQSQTAQIETRLIVQFSTAQNPSNKIVQSPITQLPSTAVPTVLWLVTYTHHLEIFNRCWDYVADKAEEEYSLCRSMSPTMVAEYKRVLIPREVMIRSLAEYCEFLKKEYKN